MTYNTKYNHDKNEYIIVDVGNHIDAHTNSTKEIESKIIYINDTRNINIDRTESTTILLDKKDLISSEIKDTALIKPIVIIEDIYSIFSFKKLPLKITWVYIFKHHLLIYKLFISLLNNIYPSNYYRKMLFSKSGFIGRTAKKRKGK